jgi:hypothetical protein
METSLKNVVKTLFRFTILNISLLVNIFWYGKPNITTNMVGKQALPPSKNAVMSPLCKLD